MLNFIKKHLPTIEIDVEIEVTQDYEVNESKKEDYGELPPPSFTNLSKTKPIPKPNVS